MKINSAKLKDIVIFKYPNEIWVVHHFSPVYWTNETTISLGKALGNISRTQSTSARTRTTSFFLPLQQYLARVEIVRINFCQHWFQLISIQFSQMRHKFSIFWFDQFTHHICWFPFYFNLGNIFYSHYTYKTKELHFKNICITLL